MFLVTNENMGLCLYIPKSDLSQRVLAELFSPYSDHCLDTVHLPTGHQLKTEHVRYLDRVTVFTLLHQPKDDLLSHVAFQSNTGLLSHPGNNVLVNTTFIIIKKRHLILP